MNVADSLPLSLRQATADVGIPRFASNTADKPSNDGFHDMMAQARKSTAPAKESAHTQKSSVHSEKTPEKDAETSAREEEGTTPEEEMILPQNLSAIPLAMPLETLLRPEIQPLEENLGLATIAGGIQLEGANTPGPRADTPIWTTEGGQIDPTQAQGQAEGVQQPVETAAEQEYTQIDPARSEDARPQAEKAIGQVDTEHARRKETQPLQGEAVETGRPLFHEVESVPVKVGETYVVDTETQDMDANLADTIRQGLDEGARQIEIRLNPEHLGAVTIQLTQSSDGALQVVLHTENGRAAGLLTQHLDGLHQALQGLGQSQVNVEVQRGQESTPSQRQFYQADPDGRGQQQQHQQQQEQRAKSDDFLHQLRLGLFPLDEAI